MKEHRLARYRDVIICLLLAAATAVVYWQVQNHEFVSYDDGTYVYNNSNVSAGLTFDGVRWAFTTGYASNWHPLTWLSHMLDCELYGLDPGPHHVTNLVFHIANSILLFLVFKRMTAASWRSGFVAALFALHPLHVESVAWIAERKDVLSTFFWLLTMWAYIRYAEKPNVRRYLTVILLFAMGLMAKPMLVTLPVVLLLLDYWPLDRMSDAVWPGKTGLRFDPKLVYEKVPLIVLSVMSSVMTFYVQQQGGAMRSIEQFPARLRVANAALAYVKYMVKAVWPLNLAVLYPFPKSIAFWQFAVAVVILLGITAAALRLRRRFPYLAVGWGWYLVTLVPVIGIVQVGLQSIADRYTYVPLIGLFVTVAWGVTEMTSRWRHKRTWLTVLASAVVAAMMVCTWFQTSHWRTSKDLFTQALRSTSNNSVAHQCLGSALQKEGRIADAIEHYREAVRISPYYTKAYYNLGTALVIQGNNIEAMSNYEKAVQIDPDFAEAHVNLGIALAQENEYEKAIRHFSEALRIDPEDADALNNLGFALTQQGNHRQAVTRYSEAVARNPESATAHYNLGVALAGQGNHNEAISHYSEALRLDPEFAEAHNKLGNALFRLNKLDDAIEHYNEAIKIDPQYSGALNNLGDALAVQGKLDEAIARYAEAIGIEPEDYDAHNDLGVALARLGKLAEAMPHFAEAVRLNPEHADARYNLGKALAVEGKLADAELQFNEAIRIDPNHAEAHYSLGAILAAHGEYRRAIAHFNETLRIRPGSGEVRKALEKAEEAVSKEEVDDG